MMKKLLFTVAMTMCVVQATMAHTSFGERPKLVVGAAVICRRTVDRQIPAGDQQQTLLIDHQLFQLAGEHRLADDAQIDLPGGGLLLQPDGDILLQLDFHVGIVLPEYRQDLGKNDAAPGDGHADGDGAAHLAGEIRDAPDVIAFCLQNALGGGDKLSALGGEDRSARAPVEQHDPQLVLQVLDALAQRGLSQEKVFGGVGKTACLGNLQKVFQLFQIHDSPPCGCGYPFADSSYNRFPSPLKRSASGSERTWSCGMARASRYRASDSRIVSTDSVLRILAIRQPL